MVKQSGRAIRLTAHLARPIWITSLLFLNDLGVLDHRDAAAFRDLAFHGNAFAAMFGEFIVDWLMFSNDEVRFAIAHDADRAASFDAFGPA